MEITSKPKLMIPRNEIQWRFSRSSGAGGQNVNKIESRVEIIFDIKQSKHLTLYEKSRLLRQLEKKIVHDCICLIVQEKRTQYENRQIAIKKLMSIIHEELKPTPNARKYTKPTKASQRKRVQLKKRRGEVKRNRQSKINQEI